VILTPGGFERFFSQVSPPAVGERPPGATDHTHADPVRMASSAAWLGTTVFGTPGERGEQVLDAVALTATSAALGEITGAYRVIEDVVAGPGPLPSRLDTLAKGLTGVASARLAEHPVHARSLILLGILAERAERAGRELPIQVPKLLEAVRPDWPEATALAAAYLFAHFPSDAAGVGSALGATVLSEPDLGRLRRCLAHPESLDLLGRVWPSPAVWTLDPAEQELDRRWRATLALTAETAVTLWRSETAALLAFMGARAEHSVDRMLRDA
jgi:hypothetical protein